MCRIYAARPTLCRYSIGLRPSNEELDSFFVIPADLLVDFRDELIKDDSLPIPRVKHSYRSASKNPLQAALFDEHPFRDNA